MKVRKGLWVGGEAGTATELCVTRGRRDRVDQSASLSTWFLRCPGQSIAWDAYLLSVIHLRPITGEMHPPVIRVPHATHEVMLIALDPRLKPDPVRPRTWRHLTPVNLEEQVELPDDAEAVTLLRLCARQVVDGYLWAEPPLSAQVEPWRTVLIKSAAHARGEEHAP